MANPLHTPQCLDTETILRYLKAQTDKEETRRVELHISDCTLCGDAMEGLMRASDTAIIKEDVGMIEKGIAQKFPALAAPPKSAPFQIWQMAAAACILMVLGLSFFFYFPSGDNKAKAESVTEEMARIQDSTPTTIANADAKTQDSIAIPAKLKDKESQPIAQVDMPTTIQKTEQSPVESLTENEKAIEEKQAKKMTFVPPHPTKTLESKTDPILAPKTPTSVTTSTVAAPKIAENVGKAGAVASTATTSKGGYPSKAPVVEVEGKTEGKAVPAAAPPSPAPVIVAEKDYDDMLTENSSATKEDVYKNKTQDLSVKKNSLSTNYLSKGKSLMKKGKYSEAIEVLSQYASDEPHYEDAQLQIAKCYLKLKQKTNANLVLDNIVSRNRKNVDAAKKMKKEGK